MSAIRSRRYSRPTPISRKTRPIWSTVEIEDLPVVLDASAPPGEFEDGRSTEPAILEKSYGDVAAAFRQAHAVVELDLAIGRAFRRADGNARRDRALRRRAATCWSSMAPPRCRTGTATTSPACSAAIPRRVHLYRGPCRRRLRHSRRALSRGCPGLRRGAAAWPAGEMDRGPARAPDRRQSFAPATSSRPRRSRWHGRILAIDDEFFHDQGGYVRTHAATVPDLAAACCRVPIACRLIGRVGHVRLTNKTPGGTYRAPGRFESTFVRERLMDAIARGSALIASRCAGAICIAKEEMPYTRPLATLGTDIVLDSGDYAGLLDKALPRVKLERACRRACSAAAPAANASAPGLRIFVEKSGLGPFEGVRIAVDASGLVEVVTGAASVGQGVETVVAQICADALGVDYRRVRVIHGRTDRIAFGMGAFASRVTVMTGEAARLAARRSPQQSASQLAAELLQQSPDALDIVDGKIVRKGAAAGPSMTLARDRQGARAGLEAARRPCAGL